MSRVGARGRGPPRSLATQNRSLWDDGYLGAGVSSDPAGPAISQLGGASGPAPVSSEQLVHDTLKRHRVVVMGRLAKAIGVDMDRRDTRSSGADDIGLDRVADVQALIG